MKHRSHQLLLPTRRPVSSDCRSFLTTSLADRTLLRGKGVTRGVQHVVERALADVEPEDIGQESRNSLEGDALGEAQIDDEGPQIFPERRALGHIRGG